MFYGICKSTTGGNIRLSYQKIYAESIIRGYSAGFEETGVLSEARRGTEGEKARISAQAPSSEQDIMYVDGYVTD